MKKTLSVITLLLAVAVIILAILLLGAKKEKPLQYGDCRDTAMAQKEINECVWSLLNATEQELEVLSEKMHEQLPPGAWSRFEDSQRSWNSSVRALSGEVERRWRSEGGILPLIVHTCFLRLHESRLEDLATITGTWVDLDDQEK